jgi:hypothetical protein
MIAAQQLDFVGKVVQGPHDRPAQQMLTACCNQVRWVRRPFLHNKEFIMKNLQLLFANVPEVTIDAFGLSKVGLREHPTKSTGINLSRASRTDTPPYHPILTNDRNHGEVKGTILPHSGGNKHFLLPRCKPNMQASRMTRSNLIPTTNNTDLPVTLRHDADARSLHPLHRQTEVETTYQNGWGMTGTTP